jgi:hypothetical protein
MQDTHRHGTGHTPERTLHPDADISITKAVCATWGGVAARKRKAQKYNKYQVAGALDGEAGWRLTSQGLAQARGCSRGR